jgi:hypothetical protein
MTIEQQAADAILQTKEEVKIAGKTYKIGKPTVGTIIMCSKYISQLPQIERVNFDKIVVEVLRTARDMEILGKICATLILGAKRVNEINAYNQKHTCKLLSFFSRKISHENEFEALAREIIDNATSKEISELISGRLADLDLGNFFGISTSLAESNILRRTKSEEVED